MCIRDRAKLEADLLKAEKTLGTNQASEQQREIELQAEVKRFEQELSDRMAASSKLEADLLKAEEALSANQTARDSALRNCKLMWNDWSKRWTSFDRS